MNPDAPVPYYLAYLPGARQVPAVPYQADPAGRNRAGRPGTRTGTGGRMTTRRLTQAEIERSDAAERQWWLSVLTLGLIPEPEPEIEP
jgi:hypothetical protein